MDIDDYNEGNGEVDWLEVDNLATDAWLMKNRKSPWAGKREGIQQTELTEKHTRKKGGGEREKGEALVEKSSFHGKEERDYQGRSWIAHPKDAKGKEQWSLLYTKEKRLVRCILGVRTRSEGHGHLLLYASMDAKVKTEDMGWASV